MAASTEGLRYDPCLSQAGRLDACARWMTRNPGAKGAPVKIGGSILTM